MLDLIGEREMKGMRRKNKKERSGRERNYQENNELEENKMIKYTTLSLKGRNVMTSIKIYLEGF